MSIKIIQNSLTDQLQPNKTSQSISSAMSDILLLCVVVALFYSTTLINTVNGNCPQGIILKYHFPLVIIIL